MTLSLLLLSLATFCQMLLPASANVAHAAPIGPGSMRPGFDANNLPANDDASTGLVPLGFNINFFGNHFQQVYVNNNGNLTFDAALPTYTPFNLNTTNHVMIAPFFADVDTRVGAIVTFGPGTVGGRPAWAATWPGVGCYNQNTQVLDNFQVVLIDRSDLGAGDFDIEFNYDRIQWDSGQASGGNALCQHGDSARIGYSNGTSTSFELPGSGIQSYFLDSATTGLIHSSRNSLQQGRYVFPVRNGTAPTGASISGHVYRNSVAPANGLSGAFLQVCSSGGQCFVTQSSADGSYLFSGLSAGQYVVTAFPPGGSGLPSGTTGTLTISGTTSISGADIVLTGPTPPPTGTGITHRYVLGGGVPVVYWGEPLTLSTIACMGGTVSYQLVINGQVVRSGNMQAGTPDPNGTTYTATLAPLSPLHGSAHVILTINCPGVAGPSVIGFDIYIDPSGMVVNTTAGIPLPDATVTLLRSDSASGPFAQVPDGSGIMDASNQRNPDRTDASGRFGWNVLAGFYQVRAEHVDCHAPGNPLQSFVESSTLTIPPPALNLELRLECADSVAGPPIVTPPGPGATPELDSLLLFGSGLSGLASYAIMRRNARRRRT